MNTLKPVLGQTGIVAHQQLQSISDAVDGNIEFTNVQGVDTNGWANNFAPANLRGVAVRVAATGGTSPTNSIWTASNTKIAHNLGFIPMGWLVIYKSAKVDVFAGTTTPDQQFIYLTTTDPTVETTLLIF